MKKISYILLLLISSSLYSQNRINYSQYMINQGVFNPGFFNADFDISGNLYYRKQWTGIEGAPTSKSVVLNFNLNEKHGIKLNIYQDQTTVFSDLNFGLGYNWKTYLGKNSVISLGLLADYGIYSAALGGVETTIANDPVFISLSNSYLNFGFGIYWESPTAFAGISTPSLFNNSKNSGLLNTDTQFGYTYATLGARFGNDNIQFVPTTMIKLVEGSPIQFDVNTNFLYNEKILFGLGYRNDNTIIFLAGFVLFDELKFIYSYDLAVLTTASHSGGSHEITLGYGISFFQGDKFSKRRYLTKGMKRKKSPKSR